MKFGIIEGQGRSDSMFIAVIFIATIYWFLDSILNIFFSNKFNLIAEMIGPEGYDIYIRAIVLCLFIIFGSHSQSVINKLKLAQNKLNESEELRRYKELFDNVAEGVFIITRKGRFIESNDRVLEATGPGISKNDIDHVFDPFFTSKKTMGMGVGLSICHGIIEDHKGVIMAENGSDGGALFTISLPVI